MLQKFRSVRLGVYFIGFLIFATPGFMVSEKCSAYIMPAEQIAGFMAANFSKFKTLIITQSIQQEGQNIKERGGEFKEKVWVKSPDFLYSKALDRTGGRDVHPDIAYRRLFIANSVKRLMRMLTDMGINLQQVALTRIDDVIAYRIGDKELHSPKILIEKKRFIPLYLEYGSPENVAGNMVRIRFLDYRKVEQGWYPFETIYSSGDKISQRCIVHTIDVNRPIDPSIFAPSKIKPDPGKALDKDLSPQEEKRLRKILETFEEKYR